MKARLRRWIDVEQWDGSADEALRLGLVQLHMVNVPAMVAWHLPTDSGPVRLCAGDWILSHNRDRREAVARIDFPRLYEVM